MERRREPYFGGPVCINTPAICGTPGLVPDSETDSGDKKPRLWPGRAKRIGGTLAFGTLAWLALNQTHKTIANSGEVAIKGSLVGGGTQMDLPPAGSVKFEDHKGLKVNIQLQKVRQESPEALKDICREEFIDNSITDGEDATCTTKVERRIQDDLEDGIKWWALRGVGILWFFNTLGWGWSQKDWTQKGRTLGKVVLSGAALAAAVAGPITLISRLTYDDNAFSKPHFSGYAQDADTVIQTARRLLKNYNGNSEQAAEWLHNLGGIQKGLTVAPQPKDSISVLVFSHSKSTPCSYDAQRDIADGYDADLELDLGDVSLWGQLFENKIFTTAKCKATPGDVRGKRKVVEGNHDDEDIMELLKSYSNVSVLDGSIQEDTFTVNGQNIVVGFLGGSDPRFTPNPLTREEKSDDQLLKEAGEKLADTYLKNPAKIQIVMTNDNRQLEAFFDKLARKGVTADLPLGLTSSPDNVTRLVGNILYVGPFGNGLSGFETSEETPGGTPISFASFQLSVTKKLEDPFSIELNRATGQLTMDPMPLDTISAPVPTTTTELISSGPH